MTKAVRPILWAIDDDPDVLSAVKRALRERYAQDYRMMDASSGKVALEALQRLYLREEPVALFVVDQRMPEMSGVQFLEEAIKLYPDAKRVLLTAYADTEVAIQAINEVQIDRYLTKPWEPAEERLYPILDELLVDWHKSYRPRFEGIRLIGHRWSPQTHNIKDFLARNRISYLWLDVENDEEACRQLDKLHLEKENLPILLFDYQYTTGSYLISPTTAQIAERCGLHTRPDKTVYDFVIVGGGPTGLAAAVYAASEGLHTLIIEKTATGGQAGTTSRIENYLGFPDGISGEHLAELAVRQAEKFKAEILVPQEVVNIRSEDPYRILRLGDGSEISSYAVLLAMGVSWRRLNVPGIDRLTGAGVYYGAAQTEGETCRGEDIYIIGGANSAGQAAVYFAGYADNVTMLVRSESLKKDMSQYLINQIEQTPNIKLRTCCHVSGVHGDTRLEALTLCNAITGEEEIVPASSVFVFIGAEPCTEWLKDLVERDERGFIYTGSALVREGRRPEGWALDRDPYMLETSLPGVFSAGDVRNNSVKRCAVGVGSGSMSVAFVHQYLATVK